MVAKSFPTDPRQKRLERIKNYIGQDLQEQALINRGGNGSAVTKPLPTPASPIAKANRVTLPVKRNPSQFAPSGPLRQRPINSGVGRPALAPKESGGNPLNRGGFYEAAMRRLKRMSK